jgi:HEAT repeat protein
LNDEHSSVRSSAADALGEIGDSATVTALIQALNDEHFYVRWRAANALGKIGNSTAVTGLIQALNDEHSSVRSSAADALGEIASPEKLPELTDLLSTTTKTYLLDTISKIQNRCKFYNYTLTQPPRPHPTPISISMTYILHLDAFPQRITSKHFARK